MTTTTKIPIMESEDELERLARENGDLKLCLAKWRTFVGAYNPTQDWAKEFVEDADRLLGVK